MSDSGGNDTSLADVTNQMKAAQVDKGDDSARERVRNANWAPPEQFNYESYNSGQGEKGDNVKPAPDGLPWAANAAKYEWLDDFGDVGPEFKELELELFGDETKTKKGGEYAKLTSMTVTIESENKISPVKSFEDAGLHPVMLKNVELCGYEIPTPIQAYVLPSILKNQDVIGIAQTGSGKTAAYLIPTLSKLMGKARKLAAPRPNLTRGFNRAEGVRAEPLILIIAPTRELSTQIFDEARRLCYRTMLRPCVVYGGAPVRDQVDELAKGCDVLIATPGRLQDFIQRPGILSLRRVKYTIIDEADEMVNPDWAEEMSAILGADSNEDDDHVYLMFSATFPKEARAVARKYMAKDHVRIRVGRIGSTHANVVQKVIFVDESKKRECLFDLMLSMPPARTMVFVNNKKAADFLDDFLYNRQLPSTSIHADRTQREREDAIRAFKSGRAPILVATGVSARGLDIKNVMHVINYDLPNTTFGGIHEYIHRIGRTARIGNVGMATSFYNDRNEDIAEALVKVLIESKQKIPEFLEGFKPADENDLNFDDDTDNEGEAEATTGDGSAWGAGDDAKPGDDANGGSGGGDWGGEASGSGWN